MEHDKLILNSHDKVKTAWDIINKESGRNKKRSETQALKVEGKKITDQQTIAETFNKYFVDIAENVNPSILLALQPWVSLGLLDNQSPLLPILRLLCPLSSKMLIDKVKII